MYTFMICTYLAYMLLFSNTFAKIKKEDNITYCLSDHIWYGITGSIHCGQMYFHLWSSTIHSAQLAVMVGFKFTNAQHKADIALL